MSVVVAPLTRGRIPTIVDHVNTVVTPGISVDVVVTDQGIAVNISTYGTPLSDERQSEYEEFLKAAGLRDEGDSDIIAWMKDEDGRLVAVGSLAGHTLKQFVVAPEIEGTGAMARIMTKLIDEAYAAGCSRLFLCTKPANAEMISSLGFYKLVETEDAVLMENRRNGLERFLELCKGGCRSSKPQSSGSI